MPRIQLQQLSHAYNRRVRSLENVTLEIPDRSLSVVMGPSGCGKTTLLRIIAGLEKPTAGSVLADGRDITAIGPSERDVAIAFQDAALYPHMTIRSNLGFAPRIASVESAQIATRINEAAELLDITSVLDRKPHELSAGEQQRAALAKCLVRRPSIMLLDEPLANLDAHLRARLRNDIRLVHEQIDCTSICVTHAWNEAVSLADQLVIMSPRRIEQVATHQRIASHPATSAVARMIGDPPMNIVRFDLSQPVNAKISEVVSQSSIDLHGHEHVTLGIAPQFGCVGTAAQPPAIVITCRVMHVTWSEQLLLTLDGQRIITHRQADSHLHAGDEVDLSIGLSDVMIFADDAQGRRVWPENATD